MRKEILEKLPGLDDAEVERFTRYVIREDGQPGPGLRIFAVLVYIGYLSELKTFIDDKIFDKHFPLGHGANNSQHSAYLAQAPAHFRDSFHREQWLFLAPYIRRYQDGASTETLQIFQAAMALPWTSKIPLDHGQGAFPGVYCVTIHDAHYDTVGLLSSPSPAQ